jgi:hypothetical protein
MTDYNKISKLFHDEGFQKEAENCKTMEDFQALFTAHGVEISLEETIELISQIAEKKKQQDDGEISEEALENVAGGLVLTGAAAVAACVGIGVVSVGVAAGAAYVAYQALRWANKHKH